MAPIRFGIHRIESQRIELLEYIREVLTTLPKCLAATPTHIVFF